MCCKVFCCTRAATFWIQSRKAKLCACTLIQSWSVQALAMDGLGRSHCALQHALPRCNSNVLSHSEVISNVINGAISHIVCTLFSFHVVKPINQRQCFLCGTENSEELGAQKEQSKRFWMDLSRSCFHFSFDQKLTKIVFHCSKAVQLLVWCMHVLRVEWWFTHIDMSFQSIWVTQDNKERRLILKSLWIFLRLLFLMQMQKWLFWISCLAVLTKMKCKCCVPTGGEWHSSHFHPFFYCFFF